MSELYELPGGWEWKKFEDLFTITSSKRVHKKDWIESGIPFYRAREIVKLSKNGFVDNELFISDEMYNSFVEKYGVPKENDILVTGVGTLGIPYVVKSNDKFYFKDGNIIWFKNMNNTNSKYIEYGFQSEFIKNQINSNSGSTVGTYTITNANNTNIPLPPLLEQQRIVSKLDLLFEKIDKSIALHQKNMDETNAFMGSVLNDVFGELEEKYGLQKVSDGLEKILTGTTPPTKEKKYYDNPSINWYSPSDFGKSKVLTKSKNMINEISLMDKKAKIYEKNTLLLVAIGATVGKIGVIKEEASSNQQITAMKFKNNIDVDFSYYWFYYIKQTIINTASAATLPIINQSAIKELKFIIPPLNIQQKIVKYLDEISEKIEKIKQAQKDKMNSLKALKASILDQAFKGEL